MCVSKVPWKFCIPTIYNFAVLYLRNLLFLLPFLFINKTLPLNNVNVRTAMIAKIPVPVNWVEKIYFFYFISFYYISYNICYNIYTYIHIYIQYIIYIIHAYIYIYEGLILL